MGCPSPGASAIGVLIDHFTPAAPQPAPGSEPT
jgi:hypothetical protein